MNANFPYPKYILGAFGSVFTLLVALNAHGATTNLATKPINSSDLVSAKPNVMFVLDDSGSMAYDFLPDWAGPYMNGSVINRPAHLFFNASFNGVAYNPAFRYRVPTLYASNGSLDTTTYPSQTGESVAQGGDSTASSTSRNWRKVKKDAYGIQETADPLASLEGKAFFYTTIPGEHCTSAQLKNCTNSASPTGAFTFPSVLRWCTTALNAVETTANANSVCQASNIANTPTNTANGVTNYTFSRVPAPKSSVFTLAAGGTVSSIKVNGLELLPSSASGSSNTALATNIANQINACSFGITGVCTALGYIASSNGSEVVLKAPGNITATPVVTGVTPASGPSAFAGTNVPGQMLLTVITPSIDSYPYPGSAVKSTKRTDCAGTTCSYIEEMTNYANWYTYYRTRMQTMKTAASRAFAGVNDTFRVGYYSINNGTGTDFLNLSDFDGAQKYAWYQKFFLAKPFEATPLRLGLADVGRFYAGKKSRMNTVTARDPIQYSCQQNYTILSTDGYWNDDTLPMQIDGTTPIGQQDGTDDRPYYDGTKFDRTESQTKMKQEQLGEYSYRVDKKTYQQQTETHQISQAVTTTTTYPYREDTYTLQSKTSRLRKYETPLNKTVYALQSTVTPLEEQIYKMQATTYPLQRLTYELDKTTTPLDRKVYNVNSTTSLLTKNVYNITKYTTPIQEKKTPVKKTVTQLTKNVYNLKVGTSLLTKTVTNVTRTTTPLIRTTFKLQRTNYQLQKSYQEDKYHDGLWLDVDWANAASCEPLATGPGAYIRNTQCRYVVTSIESGLSTCTSIAKSSGTGNWTVAQAADCTYQGTASTVETMAAGQTCTVVAQTTAATKPQQVQCAYSGTSVPVSGYTTCVANDQTGQATMTNDKVACSFDSTVASTANSQSTCTYNVPAGASASKTICTYAAETFQYNKTACTAATPATSTANGTVYSGPAISCAKDTTTGPVATPNQSTCTWVVPTGNASPITECVYQTTSSDTSNQTACAKVNKATNTANGQVWNSAVACSWDTANAVTTTPNPATCTSSIPPSATATKTECTYLTEGAAVPNQATCAYMAKNTNTATGQVYKTGVRCERDASPTSTTPGQASCTWVKPANNTSSITECSYQAAGAAVPNLTVCAAATPATDTTNGALWNKAVSCAYDTNPVITQGVGTCTWVVPSPAASATRTDCEYAVARQTVLQNQTSCTAQNPGTVTTNNSIWTGPSVVCTYRAPILADNLSSCSPSGTPGGPTNFLSYSTCGYGAGVLTGSDLMTCTPDAQEPGPNYTNGSWTSCTYQATPTITDRNSCTPVLPSATKAETRCFYNTARLVTSAQPSCTWQDQSGTTKTGPQVSCAYSATALSGPTAVSEGGSCETRSQSTSTNGTTWTGDKEVCAYGSEGSATTVTSCLVRDKYTTNLKIGPARRCVYAGWTGLSDFTGTTCTNQVQSADGNGNTRVGPARECVYTLGTTPVYKSACTSVNRSPGPNSFTQKIAKECVAGQFPVIAGPVTSTVDSCSTTPTSVSTGTPATVVSTATSCTYLAASLADTPTCSARAADVGPDFQTWRACPVRDTGWLAVAPTCSPVGTATPSLIFDGTGKVVDCRSTDLVGSASQADKVPACPAGADPTLVNKVTNPTTQVQSTCSYLKNTTPVAVPACVETMDADYVKTICAPTSISSVAGGCKIESPTAGNEYKTVTCNRKAGTGTENTLADVAAYYYKTDLRTPALGNCDGAIVSPATVANTLCTTTDEMNNVRTSGSDSNKAQHMTTFTLGLGASGYMQYASNYDSATGGDFATVKGNAPYAPDNGITADPANGVCSWQAGEQCNWPYPSENEQTTIDDLWHAGVNGRGAYFSAGEPESLANSILSALDGIKAAGGSAAAPAMSSRKLDLGNSYTFRTGYKSGAWTGDLVRYTLDPFTSQPFDSEHPDWSAQSKLDGLLHSARKIYVYDATAGTTKRKEFNATNFGSHANFSRTYLSASPGGLSQYLCVGDDDCLSESDKDSAAGVNLVNYLRGDRSNEDSLATKRLYRARQHVLGDFVNSKPAYLDKPGFAYADPGYTTFVTNQASRQPAIFAGSNDGMLHAFSVKGSASTETLVTAAAKANALVSLEPGNADLVTAAAIATSAAKAAVTADSSIGQEMWAYIPSMVISNLYKLADKKYKDKHRFYVDGTPIIGDICISSCTSTGAVWKTILVGGLDRGGRGYYALDVTDPTNPNVLWEYTNSNLGYSYGNPEITKLSNGTWVVMFASGHNNIPNEDGTGGDGVGRLFVLDAATGVPVSSVSPISTGRGSLTTPSGLVKIIAQVANPSVNNTVEAVYGGDLLGNLWRFDPNGSIGQSGVDAQLLAVLKDGAGNLQPITSKPEIALIENSKVLFVGTGRFLDESDASDKSQQTLYAIKDPRTAATVAATAIFDNPGGSPRVSGTGVTTTSPNGFVRQVQTETVCGDITTTEKREFCLSAGTGAKIRTSTNNPVNFTTNNGWFVDLVSDGERVNTDPELGLGLLAFNTNAPSIASCELGGSSYSYFLDYLTGGPIYSPGNGTPAAENGIASAFLAKEFASGPLLVTTKGGKLVIVSGLSGGGIKAFIPPQPNPASIARRTSWRELIRGN